ncbi:MAG: anthranilate synthase component I family protein [Kofleriaceae bacterium]
MSQRGWPASAGAFCLHSGRDDDGLGKHSFVTAMPSAVLMARGRSLVRLDANGSATKRWTADPFDAVEEFLAEHGCTTALAPGAPAPRVIGYFSYDLARVVEKLPGGPSLGNDTPDLWLAAYDGVARVSGDTYELVGPDPGQLERAIANGPQALGLLPAITALVPDDDGGHHMARVERVRDYLASGDVYQVNLARRLVGRITSPGDPLALYARLAAVNPAPYGALIEADGVSLLSSSPERFLASSGDRIETRPIKGTRPPGFADELAASPKDAAEHLMIVDLERNDLGRVAETGSVRVDSLGYVVELPTLLHKVSRVSAKPRSNVGYAELLRATFPGGSITGAPKVRAMQLIDELEPARRGPYCGAFGYFAPSGFELAIAIRIGVIKGYELRVHVGGGIVADSDPAAELEETELKAAGWKQALARVGSER